MGLIQSNFSQEKKSRPKKKEPVNLRPSIQESPYWLSPILPRNDLYYVIDCESTGTAPMRAEILTLSISANNKKGKIDEAEFTFRPETNYWEEEAEKVHGINRYTAARFQDSISSTSALESFLKRHGRGHFVCHALKFSGYFDSSLLLSHYHRLGRQHDLYGFFNLNMSTITWFKFLNRIGAETNAEFNLAYLCKKYRIPLDHHNAKSDREACEALFRIVLSHWDKFEDRENGLWVSFAE